MEAGTKFDQVRGNIQRLRINVRKNGDRIFNHIIVCYFYRRRPKKFTPRCLFCYSKSEITREHVVPKWLVDQSKVRHFNSTVNRFDFQFSKVFVPACRTCNNEILGSIERYLINRFEEIDSFKKPVTIGDLDIIIRWLEIIDYKFHLMNLIQRFIKFKGTKFDARVAKFPLAILRRDATPMEVLTQLKRSMKRMATENKKSRYGAFMQFHKLQDTEDDIFLHGMDNFIGLEIPNHKVAFFYFYRRKFASQQDLMKAIGEVVKNA